MAAYSGMTVAEMTELRAKLRERGATIRVVKNRLAKIALKGKPYEAVAEKFTGPVAMKKSLMSLASRHCPNCHPAKSSFLWRLSFCWRQLRAFLLPSCRLHGTFPAQSRQSRKKQRRNLRLHSRKLDKKPSSGNTSWLMLQNSLKNSSV